MALPILQAAMLCETITTDSDGRPYQLQTPVHTIRWPASVPMTGKYRLPTFDLYLRFAEVDKDFLLQAKLTRYGSDIAIYRTGSIRVYAQPGRNVLIPKEYAVEMDALEIPRPGDYSLVVTVNYVEMNAPADPERRSDAMVTINVLRPDASDPMGGAV
ncbi:MAG: hypothetical protein ACRC8S_07630 [Fimbriiglobus sp.]